MENPGMEQAEDQISELNKVPKTANKKNPPKTDVSSVGGRSELGNLDGNLKNETSEQNSCGFHRDNTRPERLWSVLLATFIAAMGPLSFGYGIGYSSAAVTQLDIASAPPNSTELHLDYGGVTWFGSLVNIGAMLGGPLAGLLIDFIGRKLTLILAGVPFSLGWLLIGFARNVPMLYSGRFISGLAIGMVSQNVPIYIAETSSAKLRGSLGTCNQVAVTLGILLSYVIGDQLVWRWSAIVAVFPVAIMSLGMILMPETARWLLMFNKEKKARKNLQWLRGPHRNIDEEILDIRNSVCNQNTITLREFFQPNIMRPFFISMSLMFFQQFSGINAMMFYNATIFMRAGFANSTFVSIFIGLVQFLSCVVGCFIMDRAGRRLMLLGTSTGMMLGCVIIGAYFYTANDALCIDISWLAVASFSVYIVAFAVGWGPCPWLMMSELFPVAARGKASGIATLFNWLCSFIVTKLFTYMLDWFTPAGTFWFFAFMLLLSFVFVFKFVPETKGKTLEEVQQYFESKTSSKDVEDTKL